MIETEAKDGTTPELTAEMIRAQLDLLIRDEVFRSSKRSVAFLKYVVEMTLSGSADQIKERTIASSPIAPSGRYRSIAITGPRTRFSRFGTASTGDR